MLLSARQVERCIFILSQADTDSLKMFKMSTWYIDESGNTVYNWGFISKKVLFILMSFRILYL